jgi:KipI family sensor histidine kinase inhibitor
MLGFTPGFPYLGGMDPALETPRLENPRVLIPAGSVGIAGKQTGAYSIDSPGGWQLIGRTPLRLFDPQNTENPTLVDAGDWVRFRSIGEDEFKRIAADVAAYKYAPEHIREGGDE